MSQSNPMSQFEAMKAGFSDLAQKNGKDDGIDMSSYDEFVPPDTLEYASVGEDGRVSGPQYHQQYSKDEDYPPHIEGNDDEFFTGGPLISEVESWKKQFDGVYLVDDLPGDMMYIYRTLNRYEYKSIMATPNTDPLMREEMICEVCVLFPYGFSYEQMSTLDAGITSTLSEHIMTTSGFSRASMPKRL